ncbi:hypothetical protein BDQ17DRAFT_121911 [Cyathus striatus]|nr:hypothetical protein BDQ17DRAFT_121911 [Cyathus striatus]
MDKIRCLEGLFSNKEYKPADVRRVTQVFDKPKFYANDGSPQANNIYQGALGDCWFMSALATVSTCARLVQTFCMDRDEDVVYMGLFSSKMIHGLLFIQTPKYEELNQQEKELYHFDKIAYNSSACQGGK